MGGVCKLSHCTSKSRPVFLKTSMKRSYDYDDFEQAADMFEPREQGGGQMGGRPDSPPPMGPDVADERLLEILGTEVQRDATTIAKDLESGLLDEMLKYMERHEFTIPATVYSRIEIAYKKLKRSVGTLYEDNFSNETVAEGAKSLVQALYEEFAQLKGTSARQLAGRQGKQQVPSERGSDLAAHANQQVLERSRNTQAYQQVLEMQDSQDYSAQGQLNFVGAQINVAQTEAEAWGEMIREYPSLRGADAPTFAKLKRLQDRQSQLVAQVHGTGYTGPSRSPSQLRLRGGVRSGSESSDVSASSSASSSMMSMSRIGPSPSPPPRRDHIFQTLVKPATQEDYIEKLVTGKDVEARFGYRAKDPVNLYKNFSQNIDQKSTVVAILKYLQFDAGISLDSEIPDAIRLTYTTGNRPTFPPGTTLGRFLQTFAPGFRYRKSQFPREGAYNYTIQMQPHDPKIFRKLVGTGNPKGTSALGILPRFGKLIDMFNKLVKQKAFENVVNVSQLFMYRPAKRGMLTDRDDRRGMEQYMGHLYSGRSQAAKGRDRLAMQTLTPFLTNRAWTDTEYWRNPQKIRSMKGPISNVNNWRKALVDFFGVDSDSLPAYRGQQKSYTPDEAEKIWNRLMSNFGDLSTSITGYMNPQSLNKSLEALAHHNAGLSLSPEAERKRQRAAKRAAEVKDEEEVAQSQSIFSEEGGAERQPARLWVQQKYESYVPVAEGLINFDDVASGMGVPLYKGFLESFERWRATTGKGKGAPPSSPLFKNALENYRDQIFNMLFKAYGKLSVPKEGKFNFLMPTKVTNHNHVDREAVKELFTHLGWNFYWDRQKVKKGVNKAGGKFTKVPDAATLFQSDTPMFPHKLQDDVKDMLIAYCAAQTLYRNLKTHAKDKAGKVIKNDDGTDRFAWDGDLDTLGTGTFKPLNVYRREWITWLEYKYTRLQDEIGSDFPVPDWRERLDYGSQYIQLNDLIQEDKAGLTKLHKAKKIYKLQKAVHAATTARRAAKLETLQKARLKQQRQEALKRAQERQQGIFISERDASTSSDTERFYQKPPESRTRASRSTSRLREDLPPVQEDEKEPLGDVDENEGGPAHEAMIEAAGRALDEAEEKALTEPYEPMYNARVPLHNYNLVATELQPMNYNSIAHVHLLQTDNNVAPVMGRVHMVRPQEGFSDKHFMHDIEGDINEGHRVLVERSRRGPFRDQGGRSTIMDRSRHVVYRKRSGVFEITVRSGVIDAELNQLMSKLSTQRSLVGGSKVTIIKGSRRYRMGLLTELDLQYLLKLIAECVDQYGSCGLELTEARPGTGPLYRGNMHKPRFKARTRRKKGILHEGSMLLF